MTNKLLSFFLLIIMTAACENTNHSTYSYLALGDSYTIGESVDTSMRWPVQLTDELRAEGYSIQDPKIVARTGWTTDELKDAMDTSTFNPPYDMVSLLIGVNNQYRGRDTSNFKKELSLLMERAIELAGGHPENVIIVSIPDWGVTPFALKQDRDPDQISSEIDDFNSIKKNLSQQKGLNYIYITDISREVPDKPGYLADDELHPSGEMYRDWVRQILPVAKGVLGGRGGGGSNQ
jgi:lysophospholipase L1-like esterase